MTDNEFHTELAAIQARSDAAKRDQKALEDRYVKEKTTRLMDATTFVRQREAELHKAAMAEREVAEEARRTAPMVNMAAQAGSGFTSNASGTVSADTITTARLEADQARLEFEIVRLRLELDRLQVMLKGRSF